MALDTFSKFFFGHTITRGNRFINFSEGAGEITAELPVGSYSLSEFALILQNSMNAVGGLVYSVAVNRDSRKITISALSNFELLVQSGSNLGESVFGLVGFTGADRTGSNSYKGDSGTGFEYRPQFKLQDFVGKEFFEESISTVINKTSEGAVEVVQFGRENFFELNIRYITNQPGDGVLILNNPTGVEDAIRFLQDITQKRRFEIMLDVNQPDSFSKVILESTPFSRDGIGFKLRERNSDSLRDYYDTGVLKLRVVE